MWSAEAAHEAGWSVAQVRWARNPPTHAGQKEHLETVLQFLESQAKFQKIYIMGFSMRASIMLNWARKQNLKRVQKLIAVCAPLDLHSASKRLTSGFSRFYDFRFTQILRSWYPQSKVHALMTIYEVDEFFTAKTHGFKDRADYYTSCSPINFLDEIQIPQHFVVAENDPLIDVNIYKKLQPSPLRHVLITEGGGHGGYGRWMKDLITTFLK
jgi:predicted alpha/beta-fold hydrolase